MLQRVLAGHGLRGVGVGRETRRGFFGHVFPEGRPSARSDHAGAQSGRGVRPAHAGWQVHPDAEPHERAVPVLLLAHAAQQLRERPARVPVRESGRGVRVRRVRDLQQRLHGGRAGLLHPQGRHGSPLGDGRGVRDGAQHGRVPVRLAERGGRRPLQVPRLDGESGPRLRVLRATPAAAGPGPQGGCRRGLPQQLPVRLARAP
mmetsp:Transcript_110808/g.292619  ORF Transcript_110808/g.292619 Transcript_110808/m.292619 type:complete len:203 (+) Transcript_110808:234-842(+)